MFALFVSFLGIFVTAAFVESLRPIAQAIAPVLGAIIGVVGVFLVTQLQFTRQAEQKTEDANIIKSWLAADIVNVSVRAQFALMNLIATNLPDGRLPPSFFQSLSKPKFDRHRDARVDWRLIPVDQLQELEYIELATTAYSKMLDRAGEEKGKTIPDELQRQIWAQLDHLRVLFGSYLRKFGRPSDLLFAEQAESYAVHDFAPVPGKPYSGMVIADLIGKLNARAMERAKRN